MFSIVLPDGELTLTTRIKVLNLVCDERNEVERYVEVNPFNGKSEANAIYIFLSKSQTSHEGCLLYNLTEEQVTEIYTSLLRDRYYNFGTFTKFDYFDDDYFWSLIDSCDVWDSENEDSED